MEFRYKLEMLPWLLGMLVVTSCVHEAGHAWAAWRCGDRRPYILRRRNPASPSHISPLFTLVVPAAMILLLGFMLGGARPVQVRTAVGPGRMALVALAGPAGNVLVAALGLLGLAGLVHAEVLDPYLGVMGAPTHYFYALFAVAFSVFLAALNLIPIPPLDGSRVVAAMLPERARHLYYHTLAVPGLILVFGGFVALVVFYPEKLQAVTQALLTALDGWRAEVQDWIST